MHFEKKDEHGPVNHEDIGTMNAWTGIGIRENVSKTKSS